MQDKKMKTEIVLLAVPAEMLLEAGIFEGDPMQMYVDGNTTTTIATWKYPMLHLRRIQRRQSKSETVKW